MRNYNQRNSKPQEIESSIRAAQRDLGVFDPLLINGIIRTAINCFTSFDLAIQGDRRAKDRRTRNTRFGKYIGIQTRTRTGKR